MELLKKYCRKFFLLLIFINVTYKGQVNCRAFNNEDCKKACELANLAEPYQGYKQSQMAFDKAIELCPKFDYAYREKSVPYLKRGDFITWKVLIDKAVEISPQANLGYRGWCQFQFLRNYGLAIKDIEAFERLVGEDNVGSSQNGNYNLEIVKALCYKELGKKAKAIEIIEKQLAKKNYPPMLFDYYHLGVLYYEISEYDKAKECLKKQITINDYYAEPYYYLSIINKIQNNRLEAKKMVDEALKYYEDKKYMIDFYTTIIDKVYKKEIETLQKNLED